MIDPTFDDYSYDQTGNHDRNHDRNHDQGGANPGDHTEQDRTDQDHAEHHPPHADEPCCFFAGTLLLTPHGEVPVETLRAGDLLCTLHNGPRALRWLGRSTVSLRFADPLRVLPIRLRQNALGPGLPSRDVLVSPDHALLIHGVLVQAGALVNGVSITREDQVPEVFTYYHAELATHELLLAGGLAVESFVDNVQRMHFDNWAAHEASGTAAPIEELPYPRAKSARQVPLSIRREIAAGLGTPLEAA